MQKQITAQAITEAMQMEFVDNEGTSTPLAASFEFTTSDPYAVSILFQGEPTPVRWTFARDLLIEGFYEPTGDGDVHVWPCLSAEGNAVVILELNSPSGEVLIQASSRAVSTFIRQMLDLVPQGAEADLLDFDTELTQLLSA
ncbi:SsgA family sporulation/cell division regulator [Nocardioides marmorisolisilvae]|uniref:SsgA family sporulation/cell division regulator n=1 Tax=Nocardioides marmorisolisilvae TaxID=1542737 RepID=A0A3N0DU43_9ACTN|nr:SsgA family sporulation/cell division regulator [Nocardioides marmorisolisilvae]RNL79155.1 SsgA family sporulation/cell division regulator [Nocardioides marmorisolisilvae]